MRFRIGLLSALLALPGFLQAAPPAPGSYTIVGLGAGSNAQALDAEAPVIVGAILDAANHPQATRFSPLRTSLGLLPDGFWSLAHSIALPYICGEGGAGPGGAKTHGWCLTVPSDDTSFHLVDLGTLGGPDLRSIVTSVNSNGLKCGASELPDHSATVPVCWDSANHIIPKPTLAVLAYSNSQINAINEAGDAAGLGPDTTGRMRCLFWPSTGGVLPLDIPGADFCLAGAINNTGKVGGSARIRGRFRGFVGVPGGPYTLLPPLPGDFESAVAAINDSDVAVGNSILIAAPASEQVIHAVRWEPDGTVTALDTLLATPAICKGAVAINHDGAIAARCTIAGVLQGALLTLPPPPQSEHSRRDRRREGRDHDGRQRGDR
jgi:hypothetical protein